MFDLGCLPSLGTLQEKLQSTLLECAGDYKHMEHECCKNEVREAKPVKRQESGHGHVAPKGGVSTMKTCKIYTCSGLIGVTPGPSPVSEGILHEHIR